MQPNSNAEIAGVMNQFRRRKILTLNETARLIGRTVHTARRRLKVWKTYHSYNQNGRYYTLPAVPEFDANGLWRWRGVFFSRYGTLRQTLLELVRRSEAGLKATEIGALLGLDPRSFLSAYAADPQLRRVKTEGGFVYYAANPEVGAVQRQRRSALSTTVRRITDAEAIAILVEKIKHPALSDKALSRRLSAQKLRVDSELIGNLFADHGLAVKKTLRLP
jgi:hypothetical protein